MHADSDTICSALLHDVLKDTPALEEEKAANEEKLLKSCLVDIRILIIKLADRLHNMRTLNYKSTFKQKKKSLETLEIYSRIAGENWGLSNYERTSRLII